MADASTATLFRIMAGRVPQERRGETDQGDLEVSALSEITKTAA